MFTNDGKLYIAQAGSNPVYLLPQMANRHGLIAGATGTGKTVSLQVLAESFSQAGVPCFMADMKGDLSGISQAGTMNPFIEKRCDEFGISKPLNFAGCPTRFFDVWGKQGHPLRATISEMGPILLARLLDLNETQTGILNIVFRIADEQQLLLIDMKDLRAMLDYVAKHAKEYTTTYGNIAPQSVGAIQRALLQLDSQGADIFFGEPAFNSADLLAVEDGRGVMNVLAADKLMLNPKLYSTFLLWLLSDLYTNLPEVGDQKLPKLVFFFDEAHTLFADTSPALVDKIEQVVRLVRSKGVGVYFVTQVPTDIPVKILAQLGNRVQHALRAFTPVDQKSVRATAQTFRPNPSINTEEAILQLGTGEALVSVLDETGTPTVVERAKMLFPLSSIGAITDAQRSDIVRRSRLAGVYDKAIDRESAFEVLATKTQTEQQQAQQAKEDAEHQKEEAKLQKEAAAAAKRRASSSPVAKVMGSAATAIGRQIGYTIYRSLLGGIFKK